MKRILGLTAGLALVLLTGCVTLSVYPYYTAKDLTFDPALLGTWVDPENTNADRQTWTFDKINERAYHLTVTENDEKTEFDVRLFKLKGHTFLDCFPRNHDDFSTPCHLLLRVDRIQPVLETRLLSYEWVDDLLEEHPKAIRHSVIPKAGAKGDDSKGFVLTADTAELQKFILKHIQTKEAWKDKVVMKRP